MSSCDPKLPINWFIYVTLHNQSSTNAVNQQMQLPSYVHVTNSIQLKTQKSNQLSACDFVHKIRYSGYNWTVSIT